MGGRVSAVISSSLDIKGVIVFGDTNTTLAAALSAAKLHIKVFHIESGLRSYDKNMPEELNRMVTDSISDLYFVTCEDAMVNLKNDLPSSSIAILNFIPLKKIYFSSWRENSLKLWTGTLNCAFIPSVER